MGIFSVLQLQLCLIPYTIKMKSHELGKLGESHARTILKKKGLKILASNYYCRNGELDIVARDQETLIFIEVKSRSSLCGIEQAVGPKKIKNLKLAAQTFMQQYCVEDVNYRFMILYLFIPRENPDVVTFEILVDPF